MTTYYVRTGGSDFTCTGLANADYPGAGTGQACAFATPAKAAAVAVCGDVINLAAGQTFDVATPIALSNKGCGSGNPVTIQSSAANLLPNGRVSSTDAPNMATVRQTSINGAFVDAAGGSYWVLDGLQITDNLAQDSPWFFDLRNGGKTKISRCYVHPKEADPTWNRAVYRGIWYEGSAGLEVVWSDFRGFLGYDVSGSFLEPSVVLLSIAGHNVTLTDNFLSAWYGTLFTGGGSNFSGDVQATLSGTPTLTSATVSTTAGLSVGQYVRVDFRGVGTKSGATFTRTSGDVMTNADVTQPYGLPLAFVAEGYVFHVTNIAGNVYTIAESFFADLPDGVYNWQAYEAVAIDTIVGNNITYHGVGSQALAHAPTTNTRLSWVTGSTGNAGNWIIQRNTLWKDPAFVEYLISIGDSLPQGKGVWEMKTMDTMTFNGNYITGYPNSIFMREYNQDGSAPWATVANLTLTNNYFQVDPGSTAVSGAAYSINLSDPYFTATPGRNILVSNNLVVNGWESLLFWEGGTLATSEHNTIINNGFGASYHSLITSDVAMLNPSSWTFRDNIADYRLYGAQCLIGGGTISDCWPSGSWSKNVIVDSTGQGFNTSVWGLGSLLPPIPTSFSQVGFTNPATGDYSLAASSPYKGQGTGGSDPGVNMTALLSALGPAPPGGLVRVAISGQTTLSGKVIVGIVDYPNPVPAIEGFGQNTTGGTGGTVYTVTNLNDSGAGSLRNVINTPGPRIIRFAVSGTIVLSSFIEVTQPNLTIDGSTAPNQGVCLDGMLVLSTNNVIIQYFRIRHNVAGEDCLQIHNCSNVVIDHCSLSWAKDENLDLASQNVTVQWCILSENMGTGALLMNYGTLPTTTVHHNLFASNWGNARLPEMGTGSLDMVNNVLYNYFNYGNSRFAPGFANGNPGPIFVNVVGNHYKPGAQSIVPPPFSKEVRINGQNSAPISAQSLIYLLGNISPNRPNNALPETDVLWVDNGGFPVTTTRLNFPLVTTTSAAQAYIDVLAGAGCTLPCRDSVDRRIVLDVTNGTGTSVSTPAQAGGWPNLTVPCP